MLKFTLSDRMSHNVVLFISVALCILGFLFALFISNNSAHAGLGGVLAVCVSFYFLFLNYKHGKRHYLYVINEVIPTFRMQSSFTRSSIQDENSVSDRIKELEITVDALSSQMLIDYENTYKGSAFITASAVIGTIFSGFAPVVFDLLT